MDLNGAQVFVQVVRAGSFTAAGRRLQMPKSTVSRRVSELETQLGVRLLQRTTRKLSLTDEGAAYFAQAAQALAQLEEAEQAVRDAGERPRGTLRITAPVDLGIHYLGELVAAYNCRYPEVRVVVELTQRRVDLVGEGFDLALRAGSMPDSSLVARKLGTARLALFASPAYLERRPPPTTLHELSDHACILFGTAHPHTVWRFEGPDGPHEIAVEGRVMCNDYSFVHAASVGGAGIAYMPGTVSAPDVEQGRLLRLLPQYHGAGGSLYAVYPSARHVTPKLRSFVDFVAGRLGEAFGQLPE